MSKRLVSLVLLLALASTTVPAFALCPSPDEALPGESWSTEPSDLTTGTSTKMGPAVSPNG